MRGSVGRWGGLADLPVHVLQDLLVRASLATPSSPRERIDQWLTVKRGEWFQRCELATLPPLGVRVPVTAYQVQQGKYGVLGGVDNICLATSDYPNVVFELDIDNAPLTGFSNVKGPLAPCLQALLPMMDAILSGQVVQWVATNLTTSAINVRCALRGWEWPIDSPTPEPGAGA
jgi:hypothetical protein